jgi:hypothetical protein
MYRHSVMVNGVLAILGLFLQRFLDMMWGTRESIYWRRICSLSVVRSSRAGYDLGHSGWIELVGRGRWIFHESKMISYCGTDYGNEMLEYCGIF